MTLHDRLLSRQSLAELCRKMFKAMRREVMTQEEHDYLYRIARETRMIYVRNDGTTVWRPPL